MAKSIRSKSRRRMRNVSRQHFAKRDLEGLYKCASTDKKELLVSTKLKAQRKKAELAIAADSITDGSMEIDKSVPKYDPKTKKDENGHYPPWMNQRAVKKHKKKVAGAKRKNKAIKW